MSHYLIKLLTGGAVALSAMAGFGAAADHLVISEVGMNGSVNHEGEYVEIFNPTPNAIDLSNYYVTDYRSYGSLAADADGFFALGTSDNLVKFPNGTMLPSGKVLVIVGKASTFLSQHFGGSLANYTGQTGNPLLFEVQESDGAVPNVETRNNSAPPSDGTNPQTPNNWNFTNAAVDNGEFVAILWWDGVADLVKDVDIVVYGGSTATSSNSPLIKGPGVPAGKNGANYAQDGGSVTNLTVGVVPIATRVAILEDGEPSTGGNGITGHDETRENSMLSWIGGNYPADATPGRTSLTVNSGNLPPTITNVDRNLQFPTASQPVTLSAVVSDSDGTVASVNFFVDSGTGFTSFPGSNGGSGTTWTATVGPFADDTLVKYYVQATDDDAATKLFPPGAPAQFQSFIVDNTPIVSGDLVINEVLYDAIGSDTDSFEWVEIHNTRSTAIDLTYVQFADGNKAWFSFPAGTTIPAKSFVMLSLNPTAFTTQYGPLPAGVNIFDWGTFGLNNNPEELFLRHLNDIDFGPTDTYLDYVPYSNVEPWPGLSSNSDGQSLELVHPSLDNALPGSWKGNVNTTPPISTPGAKNSVFAGVLITNVARNIESPAAGQAVTITATITPAGTTTVSGAKVYVNTGSGFTATNMTATATPNVYTANIGGWPAGTRIQYYVEGTNNLAETGVYPDTAPTKFLVFYAGATIPATGSLVINEILYDNVGTDNYEFVEILNTTGNSINLSDYVFTDNNNQPFLLPVGTTIAANGYVVLTLDAFFFSGQYVVPGGAPVVGWNREFNLDNGAAGDTVSIYHPNQFKADGSGTPLSRISYTPLAPWPTWTNAPTNTEPDSPNVTGRSIELINPLSPLRETAELWAWTTRTESAGIMGSPGAQNSVYSTSAVSDWTLY